jgi:hypothetical protein
MEPYSVNDNIVNWSGFYKTEELAQKSLEERVAVLSKKKKILSAKKELQVRKPSNELLHKLNEKRKSITDGMFLYKFTVVLCNDKDSTDKKNI